MRCVFFSISRGPAAGSKRSAAVGAKSDPQGGGVPERRTVDEAWQRQRAGAEDQVLRAPSTSYADQDRDILNAMPSVRQLRQKFASVDQTSVESSDDPIVMPRRVSQRRT